VAVSLGLDAGLLELGELDECAGVLAIDCKAQWSIHIYQKAVIVRAHLSRVSM
jgi:hypothetical protein